MRFRTALYVAVPLLLAGALIVGCDSADDATGRVIVRITDAPVDNVTEINVTIEACELIDSATDEHQVIPSTDNAKNFNLLEYTEGATVDVCDQDIVLASFDQLRIIIGEDPTIRIGDGPQIDLKVASGASSGLKFFFDEPVSLGGALLDVTLDFVADESVHTTGPVDEPGYVMTPVIRVVTATVASLEVELTEEGAVPSEVQ